MIVNCQLEAVIPPLAILIKLCKNVLVEKICWLQPHFLLFFGFQNNEERGIFLL